MFLSESFFLENISFKSIYIKILHYEQLFAKFDLKENEMEII